MLALGGLVDEGQQRSLDRIPTEATIYLDCGHAIGTNTHLVRMTSVQAEAFQTLVDMIGRFDKISYEEGVSQGSSILRKLAGGEMHPHDFAAAREFTEKEKA